VASLVREDPPRLIAAAGLGPGMVSLYGAHDNDHLVIDNRPGGWVVFYTERGGEFDLQQHPTEDAACRDLLQRLKIAH